MSRKWVEKEGPVWVEKGIVTQDQVERILSLYEDKKHAIGLLPIFGSILVGLGILSFIAANWQEIPQWVRLVMIAAVMTGFYTAGDRAVKKGHDRLGIALIGLGVISFGGGIILIGQMFHLIAYNAGSFILWASAGAAAAFLYRSRYLFLLSLLLFDVAQFYSVSEMSAFSYAAFAIMTIALGYYSWKWRSTLLIWCFSLSFCLHALMWVISQEIKAVWIFIPIMALYTAGDFLKNRSNAYALQTAPLAAAYLFSTSIVLFQEQTSQRFLDELRAEPLYYIICLVVLFALSLYGKFQRKKGMEALEWILLLPFLYLTTGSDVLYLLAMFIFSLYVLWSGYAEEWRFKINFGTFLFICTTLIAYGKFTWDFMDKSLFFIIGGLLLFGLSWFLNRRKKQFFRDIKEEEKPNE